MRLLEVTFVPFIFAAFFRVVLITDKLKETSV